VHDVEKIWGTMMSEVIVPVDFVVGVLSLLIIGVILGLLRVEEIDGNFVLFDQQTPDQEHRGALVRVFENGVQYNVQTLDEIRNRLHP